MAKAKKYPQMSAKEKADWWALDDYVKHNIMGYVDEGLNRQMVLRLKGLRYGQVIANNNSHKYSNYSFKTILNTFKICSVQIKNAIKGKTFKDDNAKFNYIMAIIDKNIANVSKRERYAKKAREEAEQKEKIEQTVAKNVEYKPKQKKNKDRFSDLW